MPSVTVMIGSAEPALAAPAPIVPEIKPVDALIERLAGSPSAL